MFFKRYFIMLKSVLLMFFCMAFFVMSPRLAYSQEEKDEKEYKSNNFMSIKFIKKVELTNGARPEIVASADRVFVVYRDNSAAFLLKIFNANMNVEITSKTLVKTSPDYGFPTDIRVASDKEYAYVFYETVDNRAGKSFLFGKKYALTDDFKEIASANLAASSKVSPAHKNGDEKLDDPIVLIGKDSIFAITRYKSSLEKSGETKYKIYEFTKNLFKIRNFDLDLSSETNGEARQASAIYHNEFYYMALPTTVGKAGPIANITPSDIVIVKLDTNWNIKDSKNISVDKSNHNDAETYVTGFKADGRFFYLTYLQINIPNIDTSFTSPLKIYDSVFNLVINELVRAKQKGERDLRPSLEIRDNRIFVGHSAGELGKGDAEIYVYEIIWGK